ncbi:transglutaminase family protein [Murdochiella massiliensis]|uniref:transglutaminase family protein n=1 Tax=Murdochiella massiliensis TaxID=1673723 RepID=UPI00082F3329|nr:transglutaminase domain-containing protein [Murdochiella massiliensis]
MKQINRQEIIQRLQSWLTTSLFAVVVSHFTLLLLGQQDSALLTKSLLYLGLVLVMILALHFWKITLGTVGVLAVIIVGQVLFHQSLSLPVLSAEWWMDFWHGGKEAIRWAVTLNAEKGPMPALFPSVFAILVAFISVLSNWALPIPILNMFFLIAPLFYLDDLTNDPFWLLWLMAGLFCVYASYAFRQDPQRRDQRPPLLFAAVLLGATMALQLIFPPELFFHESISQRLRQMMPAQTGTEISTFSLADLGFYPQGKLRIGGPVVLKDAPYMTIHAEAPAFYLRGSSFDAFDGKSWSLSAPQTLLPLHFSEHYYDEFDTQQAKTFWFADVASRDTAIQTGLFRPTLYYLRTENPTRIVFHGGKPASVVHLKAEPPVGTDTQELLKKYNAGTAFFYSPSGMIASATDYNDHGIVNLDFVPLVANYWKGQIQESINPAKGKGKEKYRELVRSRDPELATILYDNQQKDFPTLIQQMRAHFDANYRYRLDVDEIDDQTGFLDYFLTNKEGYCVYFATAYSVLLRDIGYSTRYAEGFIIPQAKETTTKITARQITAKQAHAWTEIYLNSMGWVPVEATPSSHVAEISGLDKNSAQQAPPEFVPPTELDVMQPQNSSSENTEESSSVESSSEASSSENAAMSSSSAEEKEKSEEQEMSSVGSDNGKATESSTSDEKSKTGIILSVLAIIAVFALLVAIRAFRRYEAWKKRLNDHELALAGQNPSERFAIVWWHIHRLAKQNGILLAPNDTLRDLVFALANIQDMTTINEKEWIAALEAIRFGHQEPDEEILRTLHQAYVVLTKNYKVNCSGWKWFVNDVWSIKGKPWK